MKQNQKLFFCLIFLFVFVYTKLIIVFNQSVSRICLTLFFLPLWWNMPGISTNFNHGNPSDKKLLFLRLVSKLDRFIQTCIFYTSLSSVQPNQSSKVLSINGTDVVVLHISTIPKTLVWNRYRKITLSFNLKLSLIDEKWSLS